MLVRCVWFLMLLLTSGWFDAPRADEPALFFVDDFEAADDRERINLAFAHAAMLDGPKTVRFARREYLLGVPMDADPFASLIGVRDVTDLTIDGQGATLVATNALGKTRGYIFKADRFTNLTVKNLTLNFRPLPFIQGSITVVDQPANRVSLRLHPDFNLIDALRASTDANIWCRVGLKSNPQHPKPASPSWMSVGTDPEGRIARDEHRADGTITLQAGFINQGETFNAELNWEAGDPMVVWFRSGLDGFCFEDGTQLTLDHVSVEAVPHYAVKIRGVERIDIRNSSVVPVPGAMLSSSADGIDIQQSRHIRIQHCRLIATGDDAISLLNHGHGINGEQHEVKFNPPWPETNERALIRDNVIEGGNRNGMLVLAHDAEIIGNKVLHTRQYGIKFTGDRTLIEANTFRAVGTFAAFRHITDELNTGIIGSDEWVQRDAIIKNNHLEDWRNMPGILIKSIEGAVVTGNRFVMNEPEAIATMPFNAYLTHIPAICVTHGGGGQHHSSDMYIDNNTFTPADWLPDRPPIIHR